ncbi:hypothetical protein L873DRAFT_718155 [Choiromyces venosus 120613-1]|uniref:F-box domain-containing protein n=1 Tax=Choiromyces venosus 120613-1 TaxID=1336337 RepID=A0A3N4JRL0_9PEZI|nr:hypothetical protein L873DRAFT_718155 [Choiromyces venosus 120613-1]
MIGVRLCQNFGRVLRICSVMKLCNLPVVILHEILDHVSTPIDLSNLTLTSKWLQNLAAPRLYRRLEFTISSTTQTRKFCECLLMQDRRQDWRHWTQSMHVSDEVREGSGRRRSPIWSGLAGVLDGLAGWGLDEFEWDSRDVPPRIIVESLLNLRSLRSLKLEMPLHSQNHFFLEKLAVAHAAHLRSMHIWGIQNDGQMGRVGRTVGFAGELKDLSLCLAADCDWKDDEDEDEEYSSSEAGGEREVESEVRKKWMTLPAGVHNTLSSIELNGLFNLRDSLHFFNPATLRRLELRQCTGYNSLLRALSSHPDIRNMEEVVLGSWENCDIARVSKFIYSCPKLKILLLSLSSYALTNELMRSIIPAVETSKATLEVLLLDFRQIKIDNSARDNNNSSNNSARDNNNSSNNTYLDKTLYQNPRWLSSIKTFPRIHELGVSIDLADLAALPEISTILPPDIRVLDLRFPRQTMERDRALRTAQIQSLVDASPDNSRLKLVILGDGDDYDVCTSYEVFRDAEAGGSGGAAVVAPANGPRGSMVAGCDHKLYRLRGDCFFI